MIPAQSFRAGGMLIAVVVCVATCTERQPHTSEVGRQVAEHLCPIQNDCDCGEDRIIADCEAEMEREIGRNEEEAITRGLELDPACLRAYLAHLDELRGCVSVSEWYVAQECAVYHGSMDIGGMCKHYEFFPPMTDCKQGLDCVDGICRNLRNPEILQEGDLCSETTGVTPTGYLGECAEGLVCDSLETRACVPHVPPTIVPMGGECIYVSQCEPGSYCRPQDGTDELTEESPGVCTALTPPGQPCSLLFECDWSCEAGVCQYPPTALCGVLDSWHYTREYLDNQASE